ncbi:MAG: tannase, partial [Eubacterium sp.]|nr:tannase [Eubacterium sp.]
MCWCPITNLDYADAAYEWNMGVTREGLSEDEQALSDGLAKAYGEYINSLGLKDEDGNVLTLEESESGIYQAGSYYDYIKEVIETSLNHFLSDTEFPYTPSSGGNFGGGRGFGGGNFGGPDGGNMRIE